MHTHVHAALSTTAKKSKQPECLSLDICINTTWYLHMKSESRSVVSNSLQPHSLNSSWTSLDQTIGVGSPSLLQRIFPTQGLNPGLPHCRQILYKLSYQGSPSTYNGIVFSFNMEGNHVTHSNMDESTCHLGCYTK